MDTHKPTPGRGVQRAARQVATQSPTSKSHDRIPAIIGRYLTCMRCFINSRWRIPAARRTLLACRQYHPASCPAERIVRTTLLRCACSNVSKPYFANTIAEVTILLLQHFSAIETSQSPSISASVVKEEKASRRVFLGEDDNILTRVIQQSQKRRGRLPCADAGSDMVKMPPSKALSKDRLLQL